MNILVTGGIGYLGIHLVNELLKIIKVKIIIFDDFSNSDPKILNELSNKKIKLIEGNINNLNLLENIFKKYEINYVYHLAAKIDAEESIKKNKLYLKTNFFNTKKIVSLSNRYKIKKFFFASSAAVYGNTTKKKCNENQFLKPINPYGKSKLYSEIFIKKNLKNTKFYIFRIFNLIGVEKKFYKYFKKRKSVFFKLLDVFKLKKNLFKVSKFLENGSFVSTSRDFIDVRDVANIFVKAIRIKKSNLIVNLGSGKPITINKFVTLFEETFKYKIKLLSRKKQKYDPKFVIASTKKYNKYFTNLKSRDIKNSFQKLNYLRNKKVRKN